MADSGSPKPELLALREQIDAIDRELLSTLNRRAALAKAVGEVKKREGTVAFRPEREAEVIYLASRPVYHPLRGDTRFESLLAKVGLTARTPRAA